MRVFGLGLVNSLPVQLADLRTLCVRYGVRSLAVFGSYARGEARRDSEIDMPVSFSQRVTLVTRIALEQDGSELMGRKIDLHIEDGLSPYLKDRILNERQLVDVV